MLGELPTLLWAALAPAIRYSSCESQPHLNCVIHHQLLIPFIKTSCCTHNERLMSSRQKWNLHPWFLTKITVIVPGLGKDAEECLWSQIEMCKCAEKKELEEPPLDLNLSWQRLQKISLQFVSWCLAFAAATRFIATRHCPRPEKKSGKVGASGSVEKSPNDWCNQDDRD